MTILLSIFLAIAGFFLSALALKLSLGVLGQPKLQNKYSTAISTSGVLSIAGLLIGLVVPLVGFLVYGVFWVVVVRSVYGISVKKSVGVALLMVLIRQVLMFALQHFLPGSV